MNLTENITMALLKQSCLFGPTEKILSTQQWLLYSIQRITVPWKFKEQNTACKQGNKVNVVKISPYIHITMAFERGRVNPTTMEVHMQAVFGSLGHPKAGSYTVIMYQKSKHPLKVLVLKK